MDHLQYLSDVKKCAVLDNHSFPGTDENSSEVSKCFPSCSYNLQHSNQSLGVTVQDLLDAGPTVHVEHQKLENNLQISTLP